MGQEKKKMHLGTNSLFVASILRNRLKERYEHQKPYYPDNESCRGFRKTMLGFLAAVIEKENFRKKVDLEKVVLKAVFGGLRRALITSMRHEMEHAPELREVMPEILQVKSEEVLSFLGESLHPVMREYIVGGDGTYEEKIVKAVSLFDNMLVCYREAVEGIQKPWFRDKYKENMEITKQFVKEHNIESVDFMMKWFETEKENGFFFKILRLSDEKRWRDKYNLKKDNVAEHSWEGAALGAYFSMYQNIKYPNEPHINVLRVVLGFGFHDLAEVISGDVSGKLKHAKPEWAKAFREYEKRVENELIDEMPAFFRPYMEEYMTRAKDDSYEGRVVAAIDKIDGLLKAQQEKHVNPGEYEGIYRQELRYVQANFQQPFVKDFLAYILHDLDNPRTMSELGE